MHYLLNDFKDILKTGNGAVGFSIFGAVITTLYLLFLGHDNSHKIFIANIISIVIAGTLLILACLTYFDVGRSPADWIGPWVVPAFAFLICSFVLLVVWLLYFIIAYFAGWNFIGWSKMYGFYILLLVPLIAYLVIGFDL